MSRQVREVLEEDRPDWEQLFRHYGEGAGRRLAESQLDTVWGWIRDPDHEVRAVLLRDDALGAVGLAHFRPFGAARMTRRATYDMPNSGEAD